jgi:hypothetical protein
MVRYRAAKILAVILVSGFGSPIATYGQNTQIRGFADVFASVKDDKVSFSFGEQDLFITSQLNDRFSFLGETVFRFTGSEPTQFSVSIERIVIKYNFVGNHNLLVGKHHTPINYWNDNYHHGRVLFPTIFRPLLFDARIIPLHTTGISLRGQNLGTLKFGYDLMVGNGIGSGEVTDTNSGKSITTAVHFKPLQGLRVGASWYNDAIPEGSTIHGGHVVEWDINQNLFTGSVSYFGDKFEVLAEGTLGYNKTDSTGSKQTVAWYAYAGYKIKEKLVPYIRLDKLHYQEGELYYTKNNTTSFVGGIRYNINYLIAVKLEYQQQRAELDGDEMTNMVTAQIAVGF